MVYGKIPGMGIVERANKTIKNIGDKLKILNVL